jgi:hypothetical protein
MAQVRRVHDPVRERADAEPTSDVAEGPSETWHQTKASSAFQLCLDVLELIIGQQKWVGRG